MTLLTAQSAMGLSTFVLIAWALSENRRAVRPRLIVTGIGLQLGMALILLKVPVFTDVFLLLNMAAEALESGTRAGTTFSSMLAVVKGAAFGLNMYLHIVALLVVLVALVSMVNAALGLLPELGGKPLTLQGLLGYVMMPLVWLAGTPWSEAHAAGGLMGVKVILNELLAYLELTALPEGSLSPRSTLIMTYAMCGFANISSLGILIGGLISIAPERSREITALGPRSILSGVLATLMTGPVVGILN